MKNLAGFDWEESSVTGACPDRARDHLSVMASVLRPLIHTITARFLVVSTMNLVWNPTSATFMGENLVCTKSEHSPT